MHSLKIDLHPDSGPVSMVRLHLDLHVGSYYLSLYMYNM